MHAPSRTRGNNLQPQLHKAEPSTQHPWRQSGNCAAQMLPACMSHSGSAGTESAIDFSSTRAHFHLETWQNCNPAHSSPSSCPDKSRPHIPSPPTLPPPRQLLFRLPSGERLTTAYQPLAHHTAGTERERGRGEVEGSQLWKRGGVNEGGRNGKDIAPERQRRDSGK